MDDRFYAYVDESGDRGWGSKSSECFILTAAIVHTSDTRSARDLLSRIRNDLGKPTQTALSLKENVKKHDERKHVATLIGEFEPVTIVAVIVHKPRLRGSAKGLEDNQRLYNWSVRLLLERLSWFARGEGRPLSPVFAHVKGFPYAELQHYLDLLRARQTEIDWNYLGVPKIEQPNRIELLQLADLASGLIYQAFKPDPYGNHEGTYLLRIAPRLYRLGPKVTSYGLKIQLEVAKTYNWWKDLERLWAYQR